MEHKTLMSLRGAKRRSNLINFGLNTGIASLLSVARNDQRGLATVSIILLSTFYFLFSGVLAALAQEKLALTVTPPLFQLTIGPGEVWRSSLKVVNSNPYDLTLYASVMNFEVNGEEGQGKFRPIIESEPLADSLAKWIDISKESLTVPREKSLEIPFTVSVPADAPPGGHYAAILVGTRPLADQTPGAVIKISSLVSSLILARVNGDVHEEGTIREFSTNQNFYQKPDAIFTLRFANTGNTHLQPRGEIVIYNMWGRERGRIPINQSSDFGNVLPKSVRKFVFAWRRDGGFLEAGRYQAVATLSFGQEARQNVSSTIYFWVAPLKPLLFIFGSLTMVILLIGFLIRLYIRKTLAAAWPEFNSKSTVNKSKSGAVDK